MGLWSAALMGGGGLGAALTPWLASHSTARRDALARWALPPSSPCSAGWRFAGTCPVLRIRPAPPRVAIIGQRRAGRWGSISTDQCRLRQSDRPAAALLYAAWRQRPVQRLAAGVADGWANRGRAAAAGAGSPDDRRQLLLCALVLQLIGFCGFIWLPQHFSALWALACGVGLGGAFPCARCWPSIMPDNRRWPAGW